MRRHALTSALIAALPAAACEAEPPGAAFPVTFLARADEPLAGVEIRIDGGRRLGTTGPDGTLRVTLSGREGSAVPFRVACPAGHREPREMPSLTLHRFVGLDPAGAARGIQISVDCPPVERVAALVVRTGRAGLPVLAGGREVARTGADGVAHALLRVPPSSTHRVVLDTSARPGLRPDSPATTLAVGDKDDIFVVEQRFVEDPPAPERRPQRPRRRPHRRKRVEEKPPDQKPVEPPAHTVPEKLGK